MEDKKKPLWVPGHKELEESNMAMFTQFVNSNTNNQFQSYKDLYNFSINEMETFWDLVCKFTDVKFTKNYTKVIDDRKKMPNSNWFLDGRLNFAENLLKFNDEKIAILSKSEDKEIRRISFKELNESVGKLSFSLREIGVKSGDRVAAFLPNIPETVIAMLSTTSIGALWSSSSPDFGTSGVVDRFGQISPKVLFAANGYYFKGKKISCIEKISEINKQIPSIEKVVIIPFVEGLDDFSQIPNSVSYDDFLSKKNKEIQFEELTVNHPVYIMYSSGTTGLPKCMVQGAGVLINHLKELVLHTNLKRGDRIFYFTTCGWMMWNWLVSSLAVGATIVLFDGNPFYPGPEVLWEYADKENFQIFGTSARYLTSLESEKFHPKEKFSLHNLKSILSTGSVLSKENFEFVYKEIKQDLRLSSISGGTDLNGCFALGSPTLPVYKGELQCRGLGMDVDIFNLEGKSVRNEKGELVCKSPFPSMPIFFWNDPDGSKYHKAYFDVYPNIWRHGDFAEITDTEGVIIYGRSDATLNPGGVRIGTSDIYRQLEEFSEIDDSVVIGQNFQNDERILLFVKMKKDFYLDRELMKKIENKIKKEISPRHVPAKIIEVPDIPYTLNMKKVEISVKRAVAGEPITNLDALLNPECLEFYKNIPELQT
ncbi:MAG: acetoacetate--CoA ligase [Leptospiraceae bacterium]|nr:acetoacetate--CoA ligase [Leptospiraceae bacterium]MCK6381230.1 acetoacetate--CoA ligase [Leptospiraceae bacterium]NUM40753.1 acetoacetate--CoA ligase [Leptospiraceae bacterium]